MFCSIELEMYVGPEMLSLLVGSHGHTLQPFLPSGTICEYDNVESSILFSTNASDNIKRCRDIVKAQIILIKGKQRN